MAASGSQNSVRRCRMTDSVEHAMPSEVMIEVTRGDPMEALHPAFPSTVIRIDVLHMKRGASDANALGQINRFVNDTAMLSVALIDGRAISAQHRFPFQAGTHRGIKAPVIDRIQRAG